MSDEPKNVVEMPTPATPAPDQKPAQSIAVIINCCDADEIYILRAVYSVVWQLAPGDKLIVVKDSADGITGLPAAIVKNWANEMLLSQKGICRARNKGAASAAIAGCRWLKFLDVDDVLAPFALSNFRSVDWPAEVKLVKGGQTTVWNGVQNTEFIMGNKVGQLDNLFFTKPWTGFGYTNPALVSNTFIDRQAFLDVGGFDENLDWEEDWDLWIRIRQKFGDNCLHGINARVCYYWVDDKERAAKKRDHAVRYDGRTMDVHEYLFLKYKDMGINPMGKFSESKK